MADIRDEHGRPIQLTDEHGRPVQLTDEHGAPIHLTGVATTHGRTTIGSELYDKTTHDRKPDATMGSETHGGTHFAPGPVDYLKHGADAVAGAGAATVGVVAGAAKGAVAGAAVPVSHTQAHGGAGGDSKGMERSTSSSSSSSEDDGQGGRRKKKGLMQKIKEKLPGSHSDKEKERQATATATAHSADTKVSSATGGAPAGTRVEYHEQEHEKKGFMDKIKDKLPGHHSS